MSAYKPSYNTDPSDACFVGLVVLIFATIIIMPFHPHPVTNKLASFFGFGAVALATSLFHAYLKDEGSGHTRFEMTYFISIIPIVCVGLIGSLLISFHQASLAIDSLLLLGALIPTFYFQWLPIRWGWEFVNSMKSFLFGDVSKSKLVAGDEDSKVCNFVDVLMTGSMMTLYQLFTLVYGYHWMKFSTVFFLS